MMNLWENILLAVAGLKSNKMRSLLTMLGIIIGISSVIMITTLGNVVTNSLNSTLNSMGISNIAQISLQMRPESTQQYVTVSDLFSQEMLDAYEEQYPDELKAVVISDYISNCYVMDGRKKHNVDLSGLTEDYILTDNTLNLLEGRWINQRDVDGRKHTIVITDLLEKKLFGNESGLGKKIEVKTGQTTNTFVIVGIMEFKLDKVSNMVVSASGQDLSTSVAIPISTCQEISHNPKQYYSFQIYTNEGVDLSKFAQKTVDFFNNRYYVKNDNLMATSWMPKDQMESINGVLDIVQLVIVIIAGISLLVGGIGVMNIMLVSVTERTREIGIRKALGAPHSAIRIQFIVESIIICLIGGVIGIIFGVINGNIAGLIVGEVTAPSPLAIIGATAFSMAIGVFFGFYPANKAAKLDPIEALRYE